MAARNWIDVVEAAYDVEAPEPRWLRGIARAGAEALDDGHGVMAFTYDASGERVRIGRFVCTPNQSIFDVRFWRRGMAARGIDPVRTMFRTVPCAGAAARPGFRASPAYAQLRSVGLADIFGINGTDPSGVGVWLGAGRGTAMRLSPALHARWTRVASHLGAAYRLRRRLAAARLLRRCTPWGADAVLSPSGRVEHVESHEARTRDARDRLRDAAIAIDRARGRLRRIDPDVALGQWMGLVDGRWSLVDKFDHDGKRYVLARRNEPLAPGLEVLTERERAISAYAALGHHNKLIAYDLGIAHSTVRVLLARAAAKLGARTRAELVERVRAEAGRRRG